MRAFMLLVVGIGFFGLAAYCIDNGLYILAGGNAAMGVVSCCWLVRGLRIDRGG